MDTQCSLVLKRLRDKGKYGYTSWEAIQEYKITRLAARISELRKAGFKIETEIVCHNKKKYARYYLHESRTQKIKNFISKLLKKDEKIN